MESNGSHLSKNCKFNLNWFGMFFALYYLPTYISLLVYSPNQNILLIKETRLSVTAEKTLHKSHAACLFG